MQIQNILHYLCFVELIKQLKFIIMKRYLNLKTNYGTETVDELDLNDFKTFKDFKNELKRLINEYHISGMNVYSSQKKAK